MTIEVTSSFGATDRLKELGSGRRRLGHDVKAFVSPVRRHLATAGGRIVGSPNALQQHLKRRHAQHQAQSPIAIIRIKPVICRLKDQSGGHEQSFMAGTRDLEKNLLLPLQEDLAIVNAA